MKKYSLVPLAFGSRRAARASSPGLLGLATRIFGYGTLFLCVSSMIGCSRFGDYEAVIRGNRLAARGLYQEATAAYLEARSGSFREVVAYDLANVYARLGEVSAASELYTEARKTGDASLRAASHYNEGIVLHEKGRYEEAWKSFRQALELNPSDEDARRNLEIAYRDWQKRNLSPPQRAAPAQRGEGGPPDEELRLLRRFETGSFRPGARDRSSPSADDY